MIRIETKNPMNTGLCVAINLELIDRFGMELFINPVDDPTE